METPKIALQQTAHVAHVLDGQRLIEPVGAANLLDDFFRSPLPRQKAGRIARNRMGDDERQQADAHQHHREQGEPAGDDVTKRHIVTTRKLPGNCVESLVQRVKLFEHRAPVVAMRSSSSSVPPDHFCIVPMLKMSSSIGLKTYPCTLSRIATWYPFWYKYT